MRQCLGRIGAPLCHGIWKLGMHLAGPSDLVTASLARAMGLYLKASVTLQRVYDRHILPRGSILYD